MRSRVFAAGVLCTLFSPATPASACGGLFCSTAPVVQSGEEIVYVLEDDGSLTMTVRLFYAGTDTDIAWILPLPAPPEISIGSQVLFTQLRAATAPAFVTSRARTGACRPTPQCVTAAGYAAPSGGGGCTYSPGPSRGWTGGYVDAAPPPADAGQVTAWDSGSLPDHGVVVFSNDSVGPYDTAVLGAASASDVTTWLSGNGYQLPPGTTALLDQYATTNHVFIALRLAPGHSASEIAPITLHLPVPEPCLPIRLTALATAPDLPITAWFLGRARTVPANFSTLSPSYANESFWVSSGYYEAEMTRQIAALGGQAFVTEYAGATPALQLEPPALGDSSTLPAGSLVALLLSDGYFATQADALRIVGAHVTPPSPMSLMEWLRCLSTSSLSPAFCGEAASADVPALLMQCDAEIVAPRRAAQAMINTHPYVTRLFTSMSAAKMTLDPEFRVDDALHEVPATHVETITTECDGQHYEYQAPVVSSIDGTTVGTTPGVLADDASYCHSRGYLLPGEAPMAMPMPAPRSGGLCGCRAGDCRAGLGWAVLALCAIAVVAWRRRHRSR